MNSAEVNVGIVMGSSSDYDVMRSAKEILDQFSVSSELRVLSAHRTPEQAIAWVSSANDRGMRVIIAAAGMAAHLAGVTAAHTLLPVIGVPLASGPLNGFDALLSTVQMPKGTPVATVGIGKAGAVNAALLALRILALNDKELAGKLENYRRSMVEEVLEHDRRLSQG